MALVVSGSMVPKAGWRPPTVIQDPMSHRRRCCANIRNVLADYTARTQRPLNHVRDFFDCIRSRRLTVANPEVMRRSMSICLAADICEQLKRNLKFDLRKAEFVGDPEANRMRSRAMRAPYMG